MGMLGEKNERGWLVMRKGEDVWGMNGEMMGDVRKREGVSCRFWDELEDELRFEGLRIKYCVRMERG